MRFFNKFIFILLFVAPFINAEILSWTDENGVRHFTNVPDECITIEDDNKSISPECVPHYSRPEKSEIKKTVPENKIEEYANDKKELAELRDKKYMLDERLNALRQEERDKWTLVRKFPKDPAYRNSLKITRNQIREINNERHVIIRRMNYLTFKIYSLTD